MDGARQAAFVINSPKQQKGQVGAETDADHSCSADVDLLTYSAIGEL